jgi:hypothetical protein
MKHAAEPVITLNPPHPSDRSTLIDMACDYVHEWLVDYGTLPPSPLITEDTATLVIRRNARRIGALAVTTGTTPDGTERSEIRAFYLHPRWRGKGNGPCALEEFIRFAPHTPCVRGTMTPSFERIVNELEIITEDGDETMLPAVTEAFMNTVLCTHPRQPAPCRTCVISAVRHHATKAYRVFTARLKGKEA